MLPRLALAGLGAMSTAGMVHEARQWIRARTRLDTGEYIEVPGWGPKVRCHFKSVGAQLATLAAAQGIAVTWQVKFDSCVAIGTEQIWRVRNCAPGNSWESTVRITGDLVKHGRLFRLVAAVDHRVTLT